MSKPFLQLRQTGWMLAYMVMPAVASLVAANDDRALDRVKYDGTRLHIGRSCRSGLLAWIYAGPFLSLWIGDRLGYDAAELAPSHAVIPAGGDPARAFGLHSDVDRAQQGQGDRAGGPCRVGREPADQLLSDRAAGRRRA